MLSLLFRDNGCRRRSVAVEVQPFDLPGNCVFLFLALDELEHVFNKFRITVCIPISSLDSAVLGRDDRSYNLGVRKIHS